MRRISGEALGARFTGYEMHMGVTDGPDAGSRPFARLGDDRTDGVISRDGRIFGTYCHGLLAGAALRGALLARIGVASKAFEQAKIVDAALDEIAAMLERCLDIDRLIALGQSR